MVNYKKSLTVILIFVFHFSCFHSAYASTNALGGWSITSKVAQGASTLINASKSVVINGSNVAKTSTALLRPTAGQVAKILARGSGAYALSVAVQMILGSVDWVLDPANSMIRYKKSAQCVELKDCSPTAQYLFRRTPNVMEYYSNVDAACEAVASSLNQKLDKTQTYTDENGVLNGGKCHTIDSSGNPDQWALDTVINPNYKPDAKDEEKTLGLDVVAQKVIDNAESASDQEVKAGSQTVTVGAVDDALQNDSATQANAKNQLDSNAKTQTKEDAEGDTKPKDPAKPELGDELSLKFPVFCSWAPVVCEAAQIAISFPQTVTNWWDTSTKSITDSWAWTKQRYEVAVTSISDFFKDESNTNTELEFSDPTQITDTSISFSNQCPAPIVLADFSYHGISQNWKMDFSQWCDVLSTIIKPIVITMASLSAVLIVSGVRENG